MPGWRAGSGIGKYNAESPKQDSKRFISITKTIHLVHLGILFIYVVGTKTMAPAAAFQLQIKVCTRRVEKKRKTRCRQIRLVCGKCVFTLAELIEEFCTVC